MGKQTQVGTVTSPPRWWLGVHKQAVTAYDSQLVPAEMPVLAAWAFKFLSAEWQMVGLSSQEWYYPQTAQLHIQDLSVHHRQTS